MPKLKYNDGTGFEQIVPSMEEFNAEKTKVAEHLAERVSQQLLISRDISLDGIQTITLPFKAKSVIVNSIISGSNNSSVGNWAENNSQRVIARRGFDDTYVVTLGVVRIYSGSSNFITGTIQNVTSTGFEISWTKSGTPTGTVDMLILANSHGGV